MREGEAEVAGRGSRGQGRQVPRVQSVLEETEEGGKLSAGSMWGDVEMRTRGDAGAPSLPGMNLVQSLGLEPSCATGTTSASSLGAFLHPLETSWPHLRSLQPRP